MKKFVAGIFSLGLIFSSMGIVSADESNDKDCDDFDSTEAAEQYWEENGYDENNDPDRLDRDKDGVPCESLSSDSSDDSAESSDESASEDSSSDDAMDSDESSEETTTEENMEEGGEMPDTSAPYATYALLGAGLIAVGGSLLVFRRQH
ncbi:excalibur calcium-binding domain-containing protein [Halobacillus mangrovi]|uniref:excalibur calcium-binding domain-containing protein n=1 Tax=Halobacillus mangrovi TaxID=402384 RepID=UPI003D98C3C0